jgi:hypothetical protein
MSAPNEPVREATGPDASDLERRPATCLSPQMPAAFTPLVARPSTCGTWPIPARRHRSSSLAAFPRSWRFRRMAGASIQVVT